MFVETICVGVAVVFLFFFCNIVWKRKKTSIGRSVPQPAGSWPLIGHLPLLSDPAVPRQVFGAMADQYGPIFMVKLGFHNAIVVSSSEIDKECFTTNDKAFATRPNSIAVKTMGYNYALFGFGPYDSYWREARKIAVLELLSNHRLELLKDVRKSEVEMSITELYRVCQPKSDNLYNPVLVEMKQWFGAFTLNVIVRMVAGKRYLNAGATKLDGHGEGERLQRVVKDFFDLVGLFVVADTIPWLEWLDFKGHLKAMKRTAKEIDGILSIWLEEHRRNKLVDGSKTEQDFMYVLLSILEDKKLSRYESDVVNKAICLNMILGGNDTTTVTLTWALSLLLNNRHWLKKAQDEIDNKIGKERQNMILGGTNTIAATLTWALSLLLNNRHSLMKGQDEIDKKVGKDRQVEESDIKTLVYLKEIFKETMRLYPAAPLYIQHEAMEDCTVAGYHIASGTRLLKKLSKIQRDPSIWSNPNEFQPERFLTTQTNVDVRSQHFELIPFWLGRRSCPGISFALQVVNLVLAWLLQGFDFETLADTPVDMTETAGLTNIKSTPLEVLIIPHLCGNIY